MLLSVIVNADDFGLTKGVNEAILACHHAGSVTSTTLMTNMGAAEHAAALATCHRNLGVGLHFNLTTGSPIASDMSTLTDEAGRFLSRRELIYRMMAGRVRTAEISRELDAQLGRMKMLGISPTHFDSHQHVHAIPKIFRVLADAATRERVPLRVPRRWPGRVDNKSLRRRFSETVLDSLTARCMRGNTDGIMTNDGLCSVFDLNTPPDRLHERCYTQLLDAYESGFIELMVHPAEVDDELRTHNAITEVSAVENRLLRSDFLPRYVRGRGGRMVSYRELAASA